MELLPYQSIAYRFVTGYYDYLYDKAQGIADFLTLHGCSATSSQAAQLSCSSLSQPIVRNPQGSYEKLRLFKSKDYSLQIDCVDSKQSLGESIVTMVVGHVYSKQCTKRSFFQTFVVAQEHVNGKLSICNNMLWYENGMASAVVSLDESGVPANENVDVCAKVLEEKIVHCSNWHKHNCDSGHILRTRATEESTFKTEIGGHISSQPKNIRVEETAYESISKFSCSDKPHRTQGEEITNVKDAINEATLAEIDEDEKTSSSLLALHEDDKAIFNEEEFASAFPSLAAINAVSCVAPIHRAPKLSYASIVNYPATTASVQKSYVMSSEVQATMPAASSNLKATSKHEDFIGFSSVIVQNLPSKITLTRMHNVFKMFGPIWPLGINLRNRPVGNPYAFINFKDSISAQKAIKASPITVDGQKVFIVEKKSFSSFQKDNSNNNKQFTAYDDTLRYFETLIK
ncbi:hypothetical protein L7F22_041784 [Adiantum nelumboides]|nr:hypothetical protein [Adiantum nelumboides]